MPFTSNTDAFQRGSVQVKKEYNPLIPPTSLSSLVMLVDFFILLHNPFCLFLFPFHFASCPMGRQQNEIPLLCVCSTALIRNTCVISVPSRGKATPASVLFCVFFIFCSSPLLVRTKGECEEPISSYSSLFFFFPRPLTVEH